MGYGCAFAECRCDSFSRILSISDFANDCCCILTDNLNLIAVKVLLDERSSKVTLSGCLIEFGLGKAPFGGDLCKGTCYFGSCPGLPGLGLYEHVFFIFRGTPTVVVWIDRYVIWTGNAGICMFALTF